MRPSFLIPFATIASAFVTETTEAKCVQELATFDDLTCVPAISEANPVGTYKGLKYKAFDVLVQGVGGVFVTGIVPQSGTQVAANGITDDILSGAPALIPASPYTNSTSSLSRLHALRTQLKLSLVCRSNVLSLSRPTYQEARWRTRLSTSNSTRPMPSCQE